MSRPAVFAAAARAAFVEAVNWVVKDDAAAAARLDAAFNRAATLIGSQPSIGRMRPELIGRRYRVWSLTGFPYLLVYNPERQPPLIVRIVHMSRDLPALADLRD